MREIKFNFVYGVDGQLETYFTKTFDFGEIENQSHWYFILDSPLMKDYSILAKRQYAGLKDKNGKEIYEGDVCEIEGGGEKTSVGEIVFQYGCFCFKPNGARLGALHPELKYYVDMEFCEIEVIGNIYESPDLLNEPVRNPNKLD